MGIPMRLPYAVPCLPASENVVGGTQGVSGGTVTLNDYEDHSWSYYSDLRAQFERKS